MSSAHGLLKANFVNDGRCRAELLGSVHFSSWVKEFWSVQDRHLQRLMPDPNVNGFRNFGTLKLVSTDSLLCKSGLTCDNSFLFYMWQFWELYSNSNSLTYPVLICMYCKYHVDTIIILINSLDTWWLINRYEGHVNASAKMCEARGAMLSWL